MDQKLLMKLAQGLAQGDPEAQKVYGQLPDEIKAQVDQMVRQMQGGQIDQNRLMMMAQAIMDGDQSAIQAYKALSPQEQQAVNQAIEQIRQGGQEQTQQTNVQPQGQMQGEMMAKSGIYIKPSHRGLLHKNLGVKKGEKIPASKLVVHKGDSAAVKKRKIFAQNAKKWHH